MPTQSQLYELIKEGNAFENPVEQPATALLNHIKNDLLDADGQTLQPQWLEFFLGTGPSPENPNPWSQTDVDVLEGLLALAVEKLEDLITYSASLTSVNLPTDGGVPSIISATSLSAFVEPNITTSPRLTAVLLPVNNGTTLVSDISSAVDYAFSGVEAGPAQSALAAAINALSGALSGSQTAFESLQQDALNQAGAASLSTSLHSKAVTAAVSTVASPDLLAIL